MQEFRSRIEDLVETEELKIRQEVAFGKYAALMPEEARQHPAKYNTELIEFLIEKYTQPGDVVADIMAGTGILGVVAALRGRNVIQVELEPKYMEWMEKARENVERLNTLTEKGRIINLLGDSRRLTELLAEHVGTIITSPPFGDTNLSAGDPERQRERLLQAGHDPSDFLGGTARNAVLKHYGQADAVIVSPPYGDAVSDDKEGPLAGADIRRYGRWREGTARKHSYTQHLTPVKPDMNVDAVITSPPYERILSHERHHTPNTGSAEKLLVEKQLGWYPAGSKDNIGNLPLGPVDAVITSPPFSQTSIKKEFKSEAELEEFAKKQWHHERGGRSLEAVKRAVSGWRGWPENPENVGNLAFGDTSQLVEQQGDLQQLYKRLLTKKGKPTYLSEMLRVYVQMFHVLRPGGVACVVVKPFVKDRKVVDLPYITWCLLRAVGFILEKAYKWRIERPSFWRVLYSKRFPEVPQVAHEYVVVVRKPGGGET
jgi:tRNA G10  N-methylase Trm11